MRYPEHIPGTKDYLGAEAVRLLQLADLCSATFDRFGYERIVLPILERADIFLQRSGEEIRSRMYILRDPRGKEICLRPEMTISAARAFLERMRSRRLPVRLSYQGEMFRYDKVREGRYRQFLQAGIEFIGSENRLAADVEAVAMALEAIAGTGIRNPRLLIGDLDLASEFINSLPLPPGMRSHLVENFWRRDAFDHLLQRFSGPASEAAAEDSSSASQLPQILAGLGESASHLLVREILSLLVEKEIGERSLDEITARFLQRFSAITEPGLSQDCLDAAREYLCISGPPDEALGRLEKLLRKIGAAPGPTFAGMARRIELLRSYGVLPPSTQLDLGFRHGIEYYTGLIFEVHCDALGPVSQICGGGRYDRLMSALGSPTAIPAVGFAIGVERLLLALEKDGPDERATHTARPDAVLTTVGDVDDELVWQAAQICRAAGWRVRAELDRRRLSSVLGHASEENVPFAVIVGEDEMRDRSVRVRDMTSRQEEIVSLDGLESYIERALRAERR